MPERWDQYIPIEKLHPSTWAPNPPVEFREGWTVARERTGYWEIQKFDEKRTFKTDDEALAHVRRCAEAGSLLHKEALAQHGTPWHPDQGGPAFK
jgi:hypothetical protein